MKHHESVHHPTFLGSGTGCEPILRAACRPLKTS